MNDAKLVDEAGQVITDANPLPVTLSGGAGPVETELPPAAIPGDSDSNAIEIPAVLSRLQALAGAVWERLKSTSGALHVLEQEASPAEDNLGTYSGPARFVSEQRYESTNIATATTTVCKSGAGLFHALAVNAAAANGVIAIYDNTAGSGTLIATITMPAALLQSQVVLTYNRRLTTGLTIVTSVAAQNITAMHR